jgi:hypothetical protein
MNYPFVCLFVCVLVGWLVGLFETIAEILVYQATLSMRFSKSLVIG